MAADDQFGPPKKVLSSLEQIDPRTLEDIAQFLEQRGLRTPISQVVGYQQLTPHGSFSSGGGGVLGTTVSAAFADMPSSTAITGLRAGTYLVAFSARVKVDAVGNTGVVGVRVNGVDPGGAASSSIDHFLFNCTAQTTNGFVTIQTLIDNTSAVLRWLVTGGTATVYEHSLVLVKIGN